MTIIDIPNNLSDSDFLLELKNHVDSTAGSGAHLLIGVLTTARLMTLARLNMIDTARGVRQSSVFDTMHRSTVEEALATASRHVGVHLKHKPLVELWDLADGNGGLIILRDSGVLWTNQTGGTYCAHPVVEGIFLPLGVDTEFQEDPFYNRWENGPGLEDKERTAALLKFLELDEWLAPSDKNTGPRGEAWVPVRVLTNTERAQNEEKNGRKYQDPPMGFTVFENCEAILTYPNSD